MQGRAEKGLFVTTGSFTAAAKKEARREGALQIDLINGDELCELLKKFKLGISVRSEESVEVNTDWFKKI